MEEVLHAAGRLEQDQQLALVLADLGKGVRELPRREGRVAGMQAQGLLAHLDNEFPPDHVEPLVLEVMHVKGGASLGPPDGVV